MSVAGTEAAPSVDSQELWDEAVSAAREAIEQAKAAVRRIFAITPQVQYMPEELEADEWLRLVGDCVRDAVGCLSGAEDSLLSAEGYMGEVPFGQLESGLASVRQKSIAQPELTRHRNAELMPGEPVGEVLP